MDDKMILEIYMMGFRDELDGTESKFINKASQILKTAYDIGRKDALCGDDVSSIDLQSNEDIIKKIEILSKINKGG